MFVAKDQIYFSLKKHIDKYLMMHVQLYNHANRSTLASHLFVYSDHFRWIVAVSIVLKVSSVLIRWSPWMGMGALRAASL